MPPTGPKTSCTPARRPADRRLSSAPERPAQDSTAESASSAAQEGEPVADLLELRGVKKLLATAN
ncbi:MAG: hypothetical protein JSU66_08940, partial [Deltaproteobacteria bacterium]